MSITNKKRGRPKGKNFVGRQYKAKDVARLFGDISASLTDCYENATFGKEKNGKPKAVQQIAKELLERVIIETKHNASVVPYNEWTGNLSKSYIATVVQQGKVTDYITTDDIAGSTNRYEDGIGSMGGRYVHLKKRNHPIKGFKYKRRPNQKYKDGKQVVSPRDHKTLVRYLRKNEKGKSYRDFAFGKNNPKFGKYRIGYLQGQGDGRIRGGIIIENTAPYAAYVQRKYRHVVQGASTRIIERHAKQKFATLVRVLSNRELKKIGIIK